MIYYVVSSLDTLAGCACESVYGDETMFCWLIFGQSSNKVQLVNKSRGKVRHVTTSRCHSSKNSNWKIDVIIVSLLVMFMKRRTFLDVFLTATQPFVVSHLNSCYAFRLVNCNCSSEPSFPMVKVAHSITLHPHNTNHPIGPLPPLSLLSVCIRVGNVTFICLFSLFVTARPFYVSFSRLISSFLSIICQHKNYFHAYFTGELSSHGNTT